MAVREGLRLDYSNMYLHQTFSLETKMKYLIWSWLSRAILKNAPILVLDEATAFADPENEYEMQLALAELVKGKTVIVIAHRLKTIRHADQIYVLDQGRVVEAGKHDELIARHGLYAKLWRLQQQTSGWHISS